MQPLLQWETISITYSEYVFVALQHSMRMRRIVLSSVARLALSSLAVSSLLCIVKLSRLTRIEKAVKNTTIFVIYRMLVYIQMSQPNTCFGPS